MEDEGDTVKEASRLLPDRTSRVREFEDGYLVLSNASGWTPLVRNE